MAKNSVSSDQETSTVAADSAASGDTSTQEEAIVVIAPGEQSPGRSPAAIVVGTVVSAAINPAGAARDLVGGALRRVSLNGDFCETTFNKGRELLSQDDTLRERTGAALRDEIAERGIRAVTDVAGMGAGSIVGGVVDTARLVSQHQELIKEMAERGVPGYAYEERDMNGDGKIDKVWVDATALLEDGGAEPVYYTSDGIPNLRQGNGPHAGPPTPVPDDPQVVAQAEALAAATASETAEYAHRIEAAGNTPINAFLERMESMYKYPYAYGNVAENDPAPSDETATPPNAPAPAPS